jgi:Sensors of blue-light using FAD
MLVRLMYASRAAQEVRPETLTSILRKSTQHNAAAGVTGLLCHTDAVYLQVLEGGRDAVSSLYNRIARDPQHTDVTLLLYEEIAERSFSGWAMGRVDVTRLNPALVLKYSANATLDPYAMPGPVALMLLDELVATAQVTCPGGP